MAQILADKNTLLEKGYAIERDGQVVLTEEGKKWLEIQQSIMAVNREFDLTKSANDNIYNTTAGIFDHLDGMIGNSKSSFSDYIKSIEADFLNLAARLAVINPLKNLFLGGDANGQLLPTYNNIGGVIGSLLGNSETVQPVTVTGSKIPLIEQISAADNDNSSWFSQAYSWIASQFHEGGMAASPYAYRAVSDSVFRQARRYHTGLAPNERPAILLDNERILSPQETLAYNRGINAAGKQQSIVSPTVNINDYGSGAVVADTKFNSSTNSFDIRLERQLNDTMRGSVRSGALDSAMNDRYGAKAKLVSR
jgi:hypothetical protein